MPCYKPVHGWRAKRLSKNGKRPIVFNPRDAFMDMPVSILCGRCIGCRLEKSRQWAVRSMHEAQLYKDNSFITLTFSDTHLPKNNSLDLEIFQKFMKRFRKSYSGTTLVQEQKIDKRGNEWTKSSYPIRFLHCGEYGKKNQRPHYHALIFNYDFPDKYLWKSHNGQNYYRSEILEKLWPYGHSVIGDVTFESAAYVARYVTKKITGDQAIDYYNEIDYTTGEVISERTPEYATMSRRPGIAKRWYDKYKDDVYPSDYIIINEKKVKPPKFYDKLLEQEHPTDYLIIKNERKKKAEANPDNSYERLQVKEVIQNKKFNKLKRGYEND